VGGNSRHWPQNRWSPPTSRPARNGGPAPSETGPTPKTGRRPLSLNHTATSSPVGSECAASSKYATSRGSPIFTTKAAKQKARQDGARERKARALSQLAVTLNLQNITLFPALPAQIPATPLDVAAITRAISSNTPIIATPLTQGALLQFNRKASNRRQRPVSLEYEIERIIADRTLSKHREFLCKWKDYPLYQSS